MVKKEKLSFTQIRILGYITREEPAFAEDIRKYLKRKTTPYNQLNYLKKKGLININIGKYKGKKMNIYGITKKGIRELEKSYGLK